MAVKSERKAGSGHMLLQAAEREVAKRTRMPVGQLNEFVVFEDGLARLAEHERGITEMLDDCGDLLCRAQFHDLLAHLFQADEAGQLQSDNILSKLTDAKNEGYAKLFIEACDSLISCLRDGGITFETDEGNYRYSFSDIVKVSRLVDRINEVKGTS